MLGHYEILAPLGAGGMAEVYRARDTKLEREVAIKVLPDDLAGFALRNKTPRRTARTQAGREQVVALLKDMENRELRAARRQGSLPYDFFWMWQELGLERDA